MSTAPTPVPEQPSEPSASEAAVRQVLVGLWQLVPPWIRRQTKSAFVVCLTAFRLILYMLMHYVVGVVFAKYIAKGFPQASRYLEIVSVSVFGFLIVRALWDLAWEERPRFKHKRRPES